VTTYYCGHCGKPRPLKGGYLPLDERFGIVLCGTNDPTAEPTERMAYTDQAYVERLLATKKAKALAKRKATLAAKEEAANWAAERNRR
jgi:hypothetical protein